MGSPAPALSSARGPPAVLIRAPLSSPEEEDGADPVAASSPSVTASSPLSLSEEERFLSGEDEPEPDFDTASERTFFAEPDEEEDAFPTQAVPPAFVARRAAAAMPKARVSREEEDVAEDVFDDGSAVESDEEELQVARVASSAPSGGQTEGDAGSVKMGGDGGGEALEEDGEDDDEKQAEAVGVSEEVRTAGASSGETNVEVGSDGFKVKEMTTEGRLIVTSASGDQETVAVEIDEEEVRLANLVTEVVGYSKKKEEDMPHDVECEDVEGSDDQAKEGNLEAESMAGTEANEAFSGFGSRSGSNSETLCTIAVEFQDVQLSETTEKGNTKEGETKAADSTEIVGGTELAGGSGTSKMIDTSVKSEDTECLPQEPNHLDESAFVEERVPEESKTEGIEFETEDAVLIESEEARIISAQDNEADSEITATETGIHSDRGFSDNVGTTSIVDGDLVEVQGSSNEAKQKIQVNDNDACLDSEISPSILAEDPVDEGSTSEMVVVSEVADDGSTPVSSIIASDLIGISEHIDYEEQHSVGKDESFVAGEHYELAEQFLEELGEMSSPSGSRIGSSRDYSSLVDGQIVTDSEEEMETDQEEDGSKLFDSAALTALLKAATGATSNGSFPTTIVSVGSAVGLGSADTSFNPGAARTSRQNLFVPTDLAVGGDPDSNLDEEERKIREKVEHIRITFLRLVYRLGYSPEDRVAMQVLYRLGLAEGIKRGKQIGQISSLEDAKIRALQLEENEKEALDFSCNILVIGKTGVGKSATINSIFGDRRVATDAFNPMTTSIREVKGIVNGVKLRVIDTPGLKPSVMDQSANMRTLASIKKYMKRYPPDIVLYVDRLDMQTMDFNDLPLLTSITSSLGPSIWFNSIIALTHAASAPPDAPNGSPLLYEVFVDQRSRLVQQAIRQASGDMRFMNPVALVENHQSCRRNREGQSVLPNGFSWRTQILLLCYSSKILSDANSILKLQDSSPGKLFGFRVRSPPLPFLLSSLLQSRAHPRLSTEHVVDNVDSDIDSGDLSDIEQGGEEEDYDQLPPFIPLGKAQVAMLSKEQKKAYFDEYDYRVKLHQKKQWKEELKRLKEMKRGKDGGSEADYGDLKDDFDQDGAPATVPVPLPDMVLPPSFDCDSPAYRYRFLEPTSHLVVRPVLDTHGWDHECGYDGVSLEENLDVASRFPASILVQITKDKKDFNIHLESSLSAKHGKNGSTLTCFDVQSVSRLLAYTLRSEVKFRNLKKNKTAAGISLTFLGDNVVHGLKVEDQLRVGKRLAVVAGAGAVRAQGNVAYGANMEMHIREKDFPVGQDAFTLGLSLVKWRNELALGTNLQSHFCVGRNTKMVVRVGLNNKLSGQITVRTSTSEQLQIALMGILPVAISVYRSIWSGETS